MSKKMKENEEKRENERESDREQLIERNFFFDKITYVQNKTNESNPPVIPSVIADQF